MRILGLDYGDSRIGVAVSDPLGWTANGLDTVKAKNGFNKAVDEIAEICAKYQPEKVVVGYPKNMDGSSGERIEKTESFIKALLVRNPELDIVRWDERLTSVAAHRTMREIGINTRKKGKGVVDCIAAELILQAYLDSIR